MGSRSAATAVLGIDAMLGEISRWAFSDADVAGGRLSLKTRKRGISNLDEAFWETIRQEISSILVRNYNAIRMLNTPAYYAWKQRARERNLSVEVARGQRRPVVYIRPGLRTGYLRERLRDVRLKERRGSFGKSVQYEVNLADLTRQYGARFLDMVEDRTGRNILLLTQDQLEIIMSKILSRVVEG